MSPKILSSMPAGKAFAELDDIPFGPALHPDSSAAVVSNGETEIRSASGEIETQKAEEKKMAQTTIFAKPTEKTSAEQARTAGAEAGQGAGDNLSPLAIFENPEFGRVRVVSDKAGAPWFIGADVAKALGYRNTRKAVRDHCKTPTPAGRNAVFPSEVAGENAFDPQTALINQSDVARLVVKSTLSAAERIQAWLFEEVLPAGLTHADVRPVTVEADLLPAVTGKDRDTCNVIPFPRLSRDREADGPVTMISLELVEFINLFREAQAAKAGQEFPSKGFAELRHSDFLAKVPEVLGKGGVQNFS
jgi:prophage antirepressor-like protein